MCRSPLWGNGCFSTTWYEQMEEGARRVLVRDSRSKWEGWEIVARNIEFKTFVWEGQGDEPPASARGEPGSGTGV